METALRIRVTVARIKCLLANNQKVGYAVGATLASPRFEAMYWDPPLCRAAVTHLQRFVRIRSQYSLVWCCVRSATGAPYSPEERAPLLTAFLLMRQETLANEEMSLSWRSGSIGFKLESLVEQG